MVFVLVFVVSLLMRADRDRLVTVRAMVLMFVPIRAMPMGERAVHCEQSTSRTSLRNEWLGT